MYGTFPGYERIPGYGRTCIKTCINSCRNPGYRNYPGYDNYSGCGNYP